MTQHKPVILLSVLFTLMSLTHPHTMAQSPEDEKTVEVVAKGYGTDVESAEKNAFLNAVEQAVGMLINAETRVNNNDVVEKIISYSDGYVESYKTLDGPKMKDGLYYIQIRAVVKQKELIASLKEENISVGKIEGKSFFAEAITQVTQKKSGQEMLPKVFENFPHRFISVEVSGKPERIEEASDDTHSTIQLSFLAKFNKAEYKVWMDAAIPILTQLADKVETLTWTWKKGNLEKISLYGGINESLYKNWKETFDKFKKIMKAEYSLETEATLAVGDNWAQVPPVKGYIEVGLLEHGKFGSKLHVFHLKADVYALLVLKSLGDKPIVNITLTDENDEPVTAEESEVVGTLKENGELVTVSNSPETWTVETVMASQSWLVVHGHPVFLQWSSEYGNYWRSWYGSVITEQNKLLDLKVQSPAVMKEYEFAYNKIKEGEVVRKVLIGPAFTLTSMRLQSYSAVSAGFVGPQFLFKYRIKLPNEDLRKLSGVEVSLQPASN